MTSQVDIYNRAMALAGARSTITSFSENNPEAQAALLWYDADRQFILRAHRWNFARKQDNLTLLATAPGVGSEPQTNLPWPFMPFAFSYAYPADCLQFQFVLPVFNGTPWQGYTTLGSNSVVAFKVSSTLNSSNQTIRAIFTNQQSAVGVWTQDITNCDLFDSQFTEAFSYRLAASVCIQLTGNLSLANAMYQKSDGILKDAESRDGNEGLTVHNPIPDWLRVRGTAANYGYGGWQGWETNGGWWGGDSF